MGIVLECDTVRDSILSPAQEAGYASHNVGWMVAWEQGHLPFGLCIFIKFYLF